MPSSEASEIVANLVEEYESSGMPVPFDFRSSLPEMGKTERATHLIHPYPAKLLRHIPYLFLSCESLSEQGDLVVDPFCGSGTVLLEAILAGRPAIGIDSNPFARLLSEVKVAPPSNASIRDATRSILNASREADESLPEAAFPLATWYDPDVARSLSRLYRGVSTVPGGKLLRFYQVCFARTARRVSLADPRLSVPVRLKPDQYPVGHRLRNTTNHHLDSLKSVDPSKVFLDVVNLNTGRVTAFNQLKPSVNALVVGGDARHLPLESESVQLVITSPPYASAQKYIRSTSIPSSWLGYFDHAAPIAYERITIGREHYRKSEYTSFTSSPLRSANEILELVSRKNPLRAHIASQYLSEMKDSIAEMARILRIGGFLVLVAAPNRVTGLDFPTHEYLDELVMGTEVFQRALVLTNKINSRALMTRRNATASIISSEHIYLYKRI